MKPPQQGFYPRARSHSPSRARTEGGALVPERARLACFSWQSHPQDSGADFLVE